MQETKHPPIGTVSAGTMRPEDLIPVFLDLLREYDPGAYEQASKDAAPLLDYYDSDDQDAGYSNPDDDQETLQDAEAWTMEDLFERLDAIAPPYCRFGAHEGDGADYGFWPVYESLSDDTDAGDVAVRQDDGRLLFVTDYGKPASRELPSFAAEVNDHGNVTLYRVTYTLTEVWSVV